jgi:ABC-type bacteriocin/lantibiotic exporter with double-glycine peptidase domain
LYALTFGVLIQLRSSVGAMIYNAGDAFEVFLYFKPVISFFKLNSLGSMSSENSVAVSRPGDLSVKNVYFKYPNNSNMVLDNVSIYFKRGTTHAIVGENGAGKTTLMKILAGLYLPTDGEIYYSNINLTRNLVREWQSIFTAVFQDYSRFYTNG